VVSQAFKSPVLPVNWRTSYGRKLNHYVGQEKLAPLSSWTCLAMALDWVKPPRLQNAPSFHYVHTDQWRYDRNLIENHL
jgi:nitrate reductase alpha subunit